MLKMRPMPLLAHLRHFYNVAAGIPVTAREYLRLRRAWPGIKDSLPSGDGHPVLVLPGFFSSDLTTGPLRRRLAEKNYAVYGWENGLNLGLGDATAARLRGRLADIFSAHGGRKVTLVGHSLGGLYARELAREFPGMVRGVVTLGAPFNRENPFDAVSPTLAALYSRLNGKRAPAAPDVLAGRTRAPLPVPSLAVYSRGDTMVDWKACINPCLPRAENIGVATSHVGLVFSLPALAAILDRLAQPEDSWKPFDPGASALCYAPPPEEGDLPRDPACADCSRAFPPLFGKGPAGP